jgi:uncharacterized membrane protein
LTHVKKVFALISTLSILLSSCSVVHKNGYHQSRKYKPGIVKWKTTHKRSKNETVSNYNHHPKVNNSNSSVQKTLKSSEEVGGNIHFRYDSGKTLFKKSPYEIPAFESPKPKQIITGSSLSMEWEYYETRGTGHDQVKQTITPPNSGSKKSDFKSSLALAFTSVGALIVLYDLIFILPYFAFALVGLILFFAGYNWLRTSKLKKKYGIIPNSKIIQLIGENLPFLGFFLTAYDFTLGGYGVLLLALGLFLLFFGLAKSSNRKPKNRNTANKYYKASAILFGLALLFFAVSFPLYFLGFNEFITAILSALCLIASLTTLLIGITE